MESEAYVMTGSKIKCKTKCKTDIMTMYMQFTYINCAT